jgi:hypothetical protein
MFLCINLPSTNISVFRPTYMMITAGAITVLINLLTVFWRIQGTTLDMKLISTSEKYWDYALHGINFAIWAASTTSFKITKNYGPAADPNVLWGYVCSPKATQLSETYPEIVRFYVQCEIQVCYMIRGSVGNNEADLNRLFHFG